MASVNLFRNNFFANNDANLRDLRRAGFISSRDGNGGNGGCGEREYSDEYNPWNNKKSV